jgi:DNA adenine methylase
MAIPIIKWVGGKRQLLNKLKEKVPKDYNAYFEPFFGGGALFFELKPENATINDFNTQLINVYNQIKNNKKRVVNNLTKYQNEYNNLKDDKEKTKYFLDKRTEFNKYIQKNKLNTISAALFIFLNKTGFNGLYRVNKNGLLNVPSAHKNTVNTFDNDNINEVSSLLKKCTILNDDFENACKNAKSKDLVFFDSPYYDTFDTYQSGGFSVEDHKRLFKLFKSLTEKNVYCILTNSNTDFIKNLYKDYDIEVVSVKRMINSDATKRTGEEVIITNFNYIK